MQTSGPGDLGLRVTGRLAARRDSVETLPSLTLKNQTQPCSSENKPATHARLTQGFSGGNVRPVFRGTHLPLRSVFSCSLQGEAAGPRHLPAPRRAPARRAADLPFRRSLPRLRPDWCTLSSPARGRPGKNTRPRWGGEAPPCVPSPRDTLRASADQDAPSRDREAGAAPGLTGVASLVHHEHIGADANDPTDITL